MKIENNYDFRKARQVIHQPDRRNFSRVVQDGETVLDNSWKLVIDHTSPPWVKHAAADLQDYLFVSMEISLALEYSEPVQKGKTFFLKSDPAIEKGYRLEVTENHIILSAGTGRGILQSGIYIEDYMNLEEAPVLKRGVFKVTPRLKTRELHSGYGIDQFPDCELDAMLHAGYDTVVVFIKGVDMTTGGYMDLNNLISRCADYGLQVLLYNYMPSFKHPDDPDADAFYDSVYGNFFRHIHGAFGFSMCGESLEFPSRDPHTTGKKWGESVTDGISDVRPSPGWYPCEDYPRYLQKIEEAIHKVDSNVEISFSTYNWGYQPFEIRAGFLKNFPKRYTLRIPFENFKQIKRGNTSCPIMDYTISQPEPGYFFESEAAEAHRLGIPLGVTSNTAGATWDFGTVPYVPVPYLWIRRFHALGKALEDWRVDRCYETHHYGWEPNIIIEMGKRYFVDPSENDLESLLERLTVRDYGRDAAMEIMKTWRIWSDAMEHYVATNEDQYGPWRTGPSYPFIFQPNITRTMAGKEIQFPTSPHAHFGHNIIKTLYQPFENENQSPGFLRNPVEVKELEKMLVMWDEGLERLRKAMKLVPEQKYRNVERLEALGHFIRNSVITTLNMKKWWMLSRKLEISLDREAAFKILDELEKLAAKEIENARDTIPAVETDSRLGWEPSMEYVCDKWHLEWKIRQVKSALREIVVYRKMIEL